MDRLDTEPAWTGTAGRVEEAADACGAPSSTPDRDSGDDEAGLHRRLETGEFWRRIPGYREVDEEKFLDHQWQAKSSVRRVEQLEQVLQHLLSDAMREAVLDGLHSAPMSLRLSPYVISLVDWEQAVTDPIRRQFLPFGSERLPDHPMAGLDSLAEQANSPVDGLVHRYHDKALFLTQDRCPVYCRFCTRSYSVGLDTEGLRKQRFGAQQRRWKAAFDYLRSHDEVEDVVVSGGDTYSLRSDHLKYIGDALLDIPHIRRIRFATKGPAVLPMKLLTDDAWFSALRSVAHRGRKQQKHVCVHTHFNHPREITDITRRACGRLVQAGVTVRNQSVLLRGVNDHPDIMRLLAKRLGFIGVEPYYVFQHDLVTGVEDLRTTLATAVELEKQVRGCTAGFQSPLFVIDVPGGGGKRDVHSHEYYNPTTGVSVFRSPNVDNEARYLYFDPIDLLPPVGRERWSDPIEHGRMIDEALDGIS